MVGYKIAVRAVERLVKGEYPFFNHLCLVFHEEGRQPSAACGAQCRFGDDSISFEEPEREIDPGDQGFRMFSQKRPDDRGNLASDFVDLYHMAEFVQHQLLQPVLGINLLMRWRKEFHALWGPAYQSVRSNRAGMKND